MGRFRDLDQIQPSEARFQRSHNCLEGPRSCHAEAVDFGPSYRHYVLLLNSKITILELTDLHLCEAVIRKQFFRDIAGGVAGKKRNGLGDFIRLSEPA
jgi:hypothetical protein